MMSSPVTRASASEEEKLIELVGTGKEFLPSEVPTLRDVIRKAIQIQQMNACKGIHKSKITISDIARELTKLILNQWQKSNDDFQPPVTKDARSISRSIESKWRLLRLISRNKANKGSKEIIMPLLDKLFDITNCRCEIYLCNHDTVNCDGCSAGAHISCSCPRLQKIPNLELKWLYYQRQKVGEKSQLQISRNDSIETKRKIKVCKRQIEEMERNFKFQRLDSDGLLVPINENSNGSLLNNAVIFENSSEISSNSNDSTPNQQNLDVSNRNRDFKVINTAAASIRYGVSQRATAAITSGFLQDLVAAGYISEEEIKLITCDPKKIFRAKQTMMKSTQDSENERVLNDDIKGIFFDGREDKTKTLLLNKETNKYHPSLVSEEHYTITQEPEGKYLHHFTPNDYNCSSKGTTKPAKRIALGLYDWLDTYDAANSLQVIGGDSTNTITGWQGGAITHLEKLLGRKCMWVICMIHLNELPLRHLIEKLDGKTCSADKFKGEIGKLLPKVDQFKINYNFKALPEGEDMIDLPEDVVKSLSTDQQNCYLLVKAIKSGNLPKDLANKKCGPINHSRWLTTAQAILMLWVRDHKLHGEILIKFEIIVKFVIQSYFKLYFNIKVKNSLVDGPKHIVTALSIYRKQPKEVQNVIKDTLSRGAYHAHPENIILALLCSNLEDERAFAIKKILEIRGPFNLGNPSFRERITPQLNFEATTLKDLILWDETTPYEPIFTCNMSKDTIKSFQNSPMKAPNFPIHSQSTERAVQNVTKACMMVYGQDKRDAYIKGMLGHREIYPVIESKKDLINPKKEI